MATLAGAVGCRAERVYPRRPITLVCPWAAGGGTDRVSRQLAAHLETELGVPVNVVNATGGKGVIGHSRGMQARPDGYTLAMITLELNMMHWSGLTELTHRDCIPLMSVNEDYAALFVRNDAPWNSVEELQAAIRAAPGKLKASGTAAGGAWHLALAGWLLEADMKADDVVWVSSTGANPSLQELLSGGLDMVCCSLPEAESLFRAGELKALGVMAPERVAGYPKIPTFSEQGTDWTLGGWRGLAVPLDTPPERVDKLAAALRRVVEGETVIRTSEGTLTFPQFMAQSGFNNRSRDRNEFTAFLDDTDRTLGELLTSPAMQSVNEDRYRPMTFPYLLFGLFGATVIGLIAQRWTMSPSSTDRDARKETAADGATSTERESERERGKSGDVSLVTGDTESLVPPTGRGRASFFIVLAAVLMYLTMVETIGFVLAAALLLGGLMLWFRVRWWTAAGVTLLVIPIVYQVFANVLRVPLPQGWLGW